jgi:hypothetical protein
MVLLLQKIAGCLGGVIGQLLAAGLELRDLFLELVERRLLLEGEFEVAERFPGISFPFDAYHHAR